MLPGLAAAAAAVPWPLSSPHSFRYWIDYQAFSSPESAALPEAALIALGGVKTGQELICGMATAQYDQAAPSTARTI